MTKTKHHHLAYDIRMQNYLTHKRDMKSELKTLASNRRDFLITAGSLGLGLSVSGALTKVLAAQNSKDYQAAYDEVTKGATPVEDKIKLEIDPYIENGNMVFYRLSVDHPMEPTDFVKRVYLLSTENPYAHVARFNFTPHSGRAAIAGRMRLAKTQNVVAIAELSGSEAAGERFYIAKRYVQVAIGGCET